MGQAFLALIRRDLLLARRIGGSGLLGLVFFLSVVTIIPFALGPDLKLLSKIGPAILWLAAILAMLLGLDRLFQADFEDGSLPLFLTAPLPLELIVLAKCMAHWLTTGLPLTLAAPFFGLMLAMEPVQLGAVTLTLLIGTPALTFIGAIGAALTASLRRGGLILAVLVLPFMIPVLIFAIASVEAVTDATIPFLPPLLILIALLLASSVIGCFAAAAALRQGE
jgi:heme exporter protein B